MTDRADHSERDLLVQSYLDGEVDAAARAEIEADAALMDEVRAHERVRAELRRTDPVDPARRERAIAAALAEFERLRAAAPASPPPPVSLTARRRRWLVGAAAALVVVAGGAVVASVVSDDSDSDQTAELSDAAQPADHDATLPAAAEESLSVFAADDTEAGDAAAAESLEATAAAPAPDDAGGSAVPPALPRVASGEELAALAEATLTARTVAGDAAAASETTAAAAEAPTADTAAADTGAAATTVLAADGSAAPVFADCGDDVIAYAELVEDESLRPVAVRVDPETNEVVALDAETCAEVLRAPMP